MLAIKNSYLFQHVLSEPERKKLVSKMLGLPMNLRVRVFEVLKQEVLWNKKLDDKAKADEGRLRMDYIAKLQSLIKNEKNRPVKAKENAQREEEHGQMAALLADLENAK